jgi:hypothetical protein
MNLPALPQISPDTIIISIYNSPTLQTIILGFFLFFIILLFALSRRFLVHSSMQGIHAGIVIGVLIIVAVEGGLIYGFTQFNKTENKEIVPPNIRAMLTTGQQQAVQVLGAETERNVPTAQTVVSDFEDLSKLDSKLVKDSICKPTATNTGTIQ